MDSLTTLFQVNVLPEINHVQLGDTATFECSVDDAADIPIQSFSWIASNLIAKEARYDFDNNHRTLHVSNVKDYDNNTSVECIVTSESGTRQTAFGHISVFPETNSPLIPRTDSLHTTSAPSNTTFDANTGGSTSGPLFDQTSAILIGTISLGFLVVIIALIVYICRLKRDGRTRKLSSLLTPTIHVRDKPPTAHFNRESDTVSVQYARPVRVFRTASSNSSTSYDVPRSSVVAPRSPGGNPKSQNKFYKQRQTTTKTLKHHRSMPSLSVTSRSLSTDGYEDMDRGSKISGNSLILPNLVVNANGTTRNRSNTDSIHGSGNHLHIPSLSASRTPSYSNWSLHAPNSASYENVDNNTHLSYSSTQTAEEVPYENQRMGRVPSFEFADEGQPRDRRIDYASLYLEDGHSSPVPSQEEVNKTTYSKIRGIIQVLRTRHSTRVNIVDHADC